MVCARSRLLDRQALLSYQHPATGRHPGCGRADVHSGSSGVTGGSLCGRDTHAGGHRGSSRHPQDPRCARTGHRRSHIAPIMDLVEQCCR